MSVQKGQFKIPDGNGGVKVCQFETSADMVEGLDEIDSFQTKYNTLSEKIDEMKTAMLDSIAEVEHNSQVRYQTALQQIEGAESGISETAQSRYEAMAARVSELEDKIDEAGIIVAQTRYTVPTVADVFTYNRQVQTPVLRNFRNTIMTIIPETSTTSATEAGEYKITVRIADGFQWEDETNEDKEISWAIQKATVSIPALSGTFTYNEQEQKPAITNFRDDVSSILTDTSVLAATDAGNYNINVKLNDPDNYTWTDGTTENKTLTWQVAKAASVLSLSANSGSVNYSGTSTFRVASQTGDGALSVTSANTNYVTATISDATITLAGVQANSDATVITVTKAETQNYAGATATYNCVVNKIAGSIKIVPTPKINTAYQSQTPATYDPDTNTVTLSDDFWWLTIDLEREGDGEVEGWEYFTDAQFVAQPGTPSGKQLPFRIVGIDIYRGTQAQETRRIYCKEGTNHKAAWVEINLVSTARRKVRTQNLRTMKNHELLSDTNPAFVYNGKEQSVDRLNDESYWKYEVPESSYKNLTIDNVKDIITPLNQFWLTDIFKFTSGSSATLPGTYQAMLELKNTTRFRWTTDPDSSWPYWQWVIDRYELTAENWDLNKTFGGYPGAPTENQAEECIMYEVNNPDARLEVTVYGPVDGFTPGDLNVYSGSTSRGQYVELESNKNYLDGTRGLTYRIYPKFTKAGQTQSVKVELTDSGKTKFRIGGSISKTFTFRWKALD